MRRKQDDSGLFFTPEIVIEGTDLTFAKGLVSGVQLETVLRQLTKLKGYHHFDDLPIPFRSIATDLVTGKAVVFSEGELANLMRASMSVPGAVAPAEFDGMMLATACSQQPAGRGRVGGRRRIGRKLRRLPARGALRKCGSARRLPPAASPAG